MSCNTTESLQFVVYVGYQNGLWAAATVALIRREDTSSSFLIGYQRLEGTVIGYVYSVLTDEYNVV